MNNGKSNRIESKKNSKKKGIIGHQSKSKKELLRTIYKLKRINERLPSNGLSKIMKLPNLSLNDFKNIERTNNLSSDELYQIAIARDIKN